MIGQDDAFEFCQDTSNEWRRKAPNGKIVGASSEGPELRHRSFLSSERLVGILG